MRAQVAVDRVRRAAGRDASRAEVVTVAIVPGACRA